MVSWLTGWLVLVGLLVGVGCLGRRLVGWVVGFMGFEYFINLLAGVSWLVDSVAGWLVSWVLSISFSTNGLLLGLRRSIFHEVLIFYYQQTTTQYAGFAHLNP